MKKIVLIIMFLIILSSSCFAISSNFKTIINVSGISRYNNQGYEINEEIYYKYNQIVYGSPELAIKEPTQRWKSVSNGLWTKNNIKGEYRLLGYNVIGNVVNNHEFPNDITPNTTPLEWTYVELDDAISSWNNISLYKYVEQKEYMQNVNLYRDNIEYDINCRQIGLNKTRVDNYSTVFTKGVIYTNRLDPYNKKWEATFITQPMDKDIGLEVNISADKDVYTMGEFQDYIDIPIIIRGRIITNSPYIHEKYIKQIMNKIYVDDYLVKQINVSNNLSFQKTSNVRIYRSDYDSSQSLKKEYTLNFKIRSTCFTQFPNDIPIYAKKDKSVKLIVKQRYFMKYDMIIEDSPYNVKLNEGDYKYPDYIKEKDLIPIQEDKIGLFEVKKTNNEKVYKKLNQTNSTSQMGSYGYICSGNNLGIKLVANKNVYKVIMSFEGDNSIKTFDDRTKKFEWDELVNSNLVTRYNQLSEYYNFYNKNTYEMKRNNDDANNVFIFEYLIPYMTKQTLHSWNSIRQLEGNSFDIDKNKIFSRISEPYKIKFDIYKLVTTETEEGTETHTEIDTKYITFDVFDSWNNLYNRDLDGYHINEKENDINYESWISNEE